jgi:hypothetical protein
MEKRKRKAHRKERIELRAERRIEAQRKLRIKTCIDDGKSIKEKT